MVSLFGIIHIWFAVKYHRIFRHILTCHHSAVKQNDSLKKHQADAWTAGLPVDNHEGNKSTSPLPQQRCHQSQWLIYSHHGCQLAILLSGHLPDALKECLFSQRVILFTAEWLHVNECRNILWYSTTNHMCIIQIKNNFSLNLFSPYVQWL